MNRLVLILCFLLFACFIPDALPAGMGMGPPSPPCGTPPFPPCPVPLDGGIWLLIAGGAYIGSKKLSKK